MNLIHAECSPLVFDEERQPEVSYNIRDLVWPSSRSNPGSLLWHTLSFPPRKKAGPAVRVRVGYTCDLYGEFYAK